MSVDDDAFEFEAKIQRGNGTDDRDTFKAKVTADTIEELDEKVAQVRERIHERESELDEIGERPERLVYDHDAREPPSKDWVYVDDGERIPWDQWEQQRQIGVERLAADGGDSS